MLPEIKVVILSRGRSETIGAQTLALMPYATVTVEESEVDDYAKVMPRAQILPHPVFDTMADLRNWLNDTVDAEMLIHVHDDLVGVRCLVGWRARRYRDPNVIEQLLERTAVCARDVGCGLFGFGNHAGGTPYYNKMKPFRLNGCVRNVIGFVRGHGLRWDPAMMGHFDVDLSLQSLAKHRIVWRDERWTFDDAPLGSTAGGFSGVRTQAGLDKGRENMLERWGSHVQFESRRDNIRKGPARTETTRLRVQRRDLRIK